MTLRRARQILAKEGPRELFERVRNCNRDGIDGDAVEEYDRWGDPDYASSEEGEAEDEDEDDDVEGEGQDDDEIEKGEGQDETEMVVVEEEEEVEAGRQEPGDSSLRCCQLLSHFGGRWGCTLRCEFMLSPDCIHARAGLMMLFVLEAANRAPTARQPPANRLPPRPTYRANPLPWCMPLRYPAVARHAGLLCFACPGEGRPIGHNSILLFSLYLLALLSM